MRSEVSKKHLKSPMHIIDFSGRKVLEVQSVFLIWRLAFTKKLSLWV